ncbi:rod shape-determining protein [Sphingomonas sp.]|uniref:rod shape-determining protein n=1 Tax=Sphingomonas sp. TaxID=28214 RepID=UPI001ED493BD|nr:rod shape-determining protein [Sphingomonas sp.]MBX3595782.1 rod shape-determining protein [Sphingomonas sp.]
MFEEALSWAKKKPDFAIDLGTANTLVVDKAGGVIFEQPSVCCFDGSVGPDGKLFAVGADAQPMIGREVNRLRTVRPLRNGVLVDVRATCELLKFALKPLTPKRRLRASRVVIGVPTDATQAERRALGRAAHDAGLAEPMRLADPMLAAIGSGLDVAEARGRMIVDCGAGLTDIVVISLGGICISRSVRGGGDAVDAALVHHLHLRKQFNIGQSTAEALKIALSEALMSPGRSYVEVKGLDMRNGLPRVLALDVEELRPIVERHADEIASAVRGAFAATQPDLVSGILDDGISLTGGAAMTALVAERIQRSTGISVRVMDAPQRAVARGLAVMLN